MNKENCALKLVNEIILYYDALSKKHQISNYCFAVKEETGGTRRVLLEGTLNDIGAR